MNILCNPTGRAGHFRGVDWWVEHNNLYLKRIYGGKYSNHTKARILKESPLIETFKNIRIQMGKMLRLDHRTIKHSPAKLATAFKALGVYMDEIRANEFVEGRKASYCIPDKKSEGMHLGLIKEAKGIRGEVVGGVGTEHMEETHSDKRVGNGGDEMNDNGDSGEEDSGEGREELDEAELEVEDDGDLDV